MKGQIMIVDDQKGVRHLLAELFKKDGWQVYIASDGIEANKILEEEETKPRIIVMDMKMPKMNGLEASKKILQKYKDIPIIMMTAYEERELIDSILASGVKKCISKPFDVLELRDYVNEIIQSDV